MKEFYNLVTVDRALELMLENMKRAGLVAPVTGTETLDVLSSVGRVLAGPVRAPHALPGFSRSTVDGYAVRARDTFGASDGLPALMDVAGEVRTGSAPEVDVSPGVAVKIWTGGMMPESADAVVMLEQTDEAGESSIEVRKAVSPGENVFAADEDYAPGDLVMEAGWTIRPADAGVLSAFGITRVNVVRRPRVAVISTGDEIVDPSSVPAPGQVRDINSYSIYASVVEAGGEPKILGIVRDELDLLRKATAEAAAWADIIIISGGSSVGARDHTLQVMDEMGEPGVFVHGVAIKPGKPTIIGIGAGKLLFGLPGHPVSALVTFRAFVRPAIHCYLGLKHRGIFPPRTKAIIDRNIPSVPGRDDYWRVRLKSQGPGMPIKAEPIVAQSGAISSMLEADGLLRIPAEKEGLMAGDEVEVELL